MKIQPFQLERWQSIWENQVEINISESGVQPLTVEELVEDPKQLQALLRTPLGYPQTNGSPQTRSRVAELYPGARAENVLMTTGCAEANFLATWALVEPGDEVVYMEPNYLQIGPLAESFGAVVKPLWLRESLRWSFDPDELKKLVTPRTRIIAVCNPNNPTGAVLTEESMRMVCECAAKVGAWVIADEVYRGAELDGNLTATFWGRYERVICNAGLSKAYSLPGLRTGWIVAPPDLTDRLWAYHDYTTIGVSLLTDRLAGIALEPERRRKILDRTRAVIRSNYPIVQQWLGRHAEILRHTPPAAGAIAWVGYAMDWSSQQLVEDLRRSKNVLLVPGSQFGLEGFLRIGFGGEAEHLRRGLDRLSELFAERVPRKSQDRSLVAGD